MKLRLNLLFACLFFTMGMLCAQVSTSAVSGVVVDALDGTPVIGASVLVQGTSTGSPTNVDGQFSFHVDRFPVTLVVSYIGYKKQEVKVTSAMPLTITLQEDSEMLDDVVITGYQTFKKSAYAGSASQVKANKIADIPALSFTELLQGNATGVQFTSSSGQPGAATSLRIRGMGSFNASKSPLFVIDGVAVRSGDVDGLSTKSGLDIMSTISNDDIESVNIIKDAAAASLYGSRAANGVIIITTKKGKKGKAQVSLKADWGSSDYAMEYRPIMNGEQRRAYIYDALYRGQIAKNKSEADATAYADKKIDDYAPEPWCGYVNWDDILFRKGGHQNYEASVSGGSDKFTYYTSLSYTNQQGITTQSGLERISGRVNAEFQATDHLKLGANLLFSTVNQDANPEGTDYTSPFYSSRNAVVPSDPVYNEDGSWNRKFIRNEDRNPALSQAYDYRRQYIKRTFNTLFAEYEFIRDLKFRTTLSYDYNTTKSKSWSDPRTSNGKDTNGGMEGRFREYKKLVWKNQLSYATTIARDHNLDALIGYEIDDASSDYVYAYGTNFAVAGKNSLSNSVKPESVGGYPGTQRIVSYLAVANYNYLHRYYLGGSYRIDGTSRLHRDSRWGNFWSVSGAWRAIDEAFMEPARGWLNELKLRMSYGVNGTLPSDTFGFMGLSSLTDGYMGDPAISPKQIANYDLSWETNYAFNVGIDFGFIDRLTGSVEFYTRTTKNLLMDMPISRTTGFSSYLKNIGEVVNRGVEFELTSANFRTKDFEWSTTFNISHNANRVAKLSDQTRILSGNKIHTIGKPYNTYYLIEFAGINPETGAPQFYTNDTDEHGNLIKEVTEDNAKAKQIVVDKHAEPVVIGGLSNKFRIKWFDLSFLFSYQFGGYSFDTWAQKTEHGGKDLKANIPTYYAESWKKPGDVTNYEVFIESPKVAMHNVTTTRRLHSSDFIRLKTLTLGFNLPAAWTRTAGLSNVRLYASANNLLTWAAYNYYDPEAVDSNGGAVWGTPPLRTVTFGVSINL